MTEVIVKRVNDVPIYLENTTYDGMFSGLLVFLLIASGFICMIYSMATSSSVWTPTGYSIHIEDFPFAMTIIFITVGFIIWFMKAFGIFSKPAYNIYTYNIYTSGRPSRIVPIQNDGTDQARVCIAVKALEREILEKSKNDANLKKIAEGCK
jgi:hypothetical protein